MYEMYGLTLTEYLLRVLIACIVGGIFGFERRNKGKPAGMKTNILACAGAAIVALTQVMISKKTGMEPMGEYVRSDTTRLIAPVVSGLGFLGAGVIMRGGDTVKGLTTAATLWLVAVLGIGIGSGFYVFILPSTLLILIVTHLTQKIETSVIDRRKIKKVELEYIKTIETNTLIREITREEDIKILIEKKVAENHIEDKTIVKKVIHYSIPKYVSSRYFFKRIRNLDGVLELKVIK